MQYNTVTLYRGAASGTNAFGTQRVHAIKYGPPIGLYRYGTPWGLVCYMIGDFRVTNLLGTNVVQIVKIGASATRVA
jgi:hypothetical protein